MILIYTWPLSLEIGPDSKVGKSRDLRESMPNRVKRRRASVHVDVGQKCVND